ncbi:MAG: hypothetical protein CMJ78_27480 [Planctomycetaceae bacterium]|nr:hypothetical protein [Planctomycetaceae bacterium]
MTRDFASNCLFHKLGRSSDKVPRIGKVRNCSKLQRFETMTAKLSNHPTAAGRAGTKCPRRRRTGPPTLVVDWLTLPTLAVSGKATVVWGEL